MTPSSSSSSLNRMIVPPAAHEAHFELTSPDSATSPLPCPGRPVRFFLGSSANSRLGSGENSRSNTPGGFRLLRNDARLNLNQYFSSMQEGGVPEEIGSGGEESEIERLREFLRTTLPRHRFGGETPKESLLLDMEVSVLDRKISFDAEDVDQDKIERRANQLLSLLGPSASEYVLKSSKIQDHGHLFRYEITSENKVEVGSWAQNILDQLKSTAYQIAESDQFSRVEISVAPKRFGDQTQTVDIAVTRFSRDGIG